MASEKFRLGRQCVFAVDGQILSSVTNVSARRVTNEIDATGFGHSAQSTLVLHRTWEIDVQVLKPADAARLRNVESGMGVVTVSSTNGVREVSADFMVCESTHDEPLDGAAVASFVLKQWNHGK